MSTHKIRKILPHELVYFISDGVAVKIGKTQGDPINRLRALQTGNSRELVLECVAWSSQITATMLEQLLHYHFSNYLIRGEWFDRQGVIKNLLADIWEERGDFFYTATFETPKGGTVYMALAFAEKLGQSIGQYVKEDIA